MLPIPNGMGDSFHQFCIPFYLFVGPKAISKKNHFFEKKWPTPTQAGRPDCRLLVTSRRHLHERRLQPSCCSWYRVQQRNYVQKLLDVQAMRRRPQGTSNLYSRRRKRGRVYITRVWLVVGPCILYFLVLGIVVAVRRVRGHLDQSRNTEGIRAYTYVVCESAYNRAQDLIPSSDVVLSTGGMKSLQNDTSELFEQLADHIFIICLQCGSVSVPRSLLLKTTFVHADRIDRCLGVYQLAHYVKVTLTHTHIIERAHLANEYSTIGIIEEDALSIIQYPEFRTQTGLSQSLKLQQWEVVRLGYKPYFFVDSTKFRSVLRLPWSCPNKCKCTRVHNSACMMRRPGCDMRSSDAYILMRTSFQSTINMVKSTGGIIDVEILRSTSPQVFVLPQLTFQESQSERSQMRLATAFESLCVTDMVDSSESKV